MSSPAARADRLSATLRHLRKQAGLSGIQAATQAGLSQTTISRYETGKRVPTEDHVKVLCRIYRADAATKRDLLGIAADLREGSIPTRAVLHRSGSPAMQARIGRIEQSSGTLRYFNPVHVIGLLQTYDYIRALLSGRYTGTDLDAMIVARLARQQVLDTHRRFQFLLTEGALRWHVGSTTVMAGQIDHISAVSELPNVRMGIIPWTRPVNRPTLHPFQIYDDRAVMHNTEVATALITDTKDVQFFIERLAIYDTFAAYGDDARAELRRIADEYRRLEK